MGAASARPGLDPTDVRHVLGWTIDDPRAVVVIRRSLRAGNCGPCRAVSDDMDALRQPARFAAGLLALLIVLAACSGGAAAPSSPPSASPPDAPVTASPSDGTGDGPSQDPGVGAGAKPIVPKPGQAIDVRPIAAEQLAARVDGNKIVVKAVWTSGVEPCTILDSIVVDKGDGTYTITLREGNSPQEIACIAIAEQHVTEFEIPDVAPGTWTIADSGGVAAPVEVTVS